MTWFGSAGIDHALFMWRNEVITGATRFSSALPNVAVDARLRGGLRVDRQGPTLEFLLDLLANRGLIHHQASSQDRCRLGHGGHRSREQHGGDGQSRVTLAYAGTPRGTRRLHRSLAERRRPTGASETVAPCTTRDDDRRGAGERGSPQVHRCTEAAPNG